MKDRRILVTGGTGFIGGFATEALTNQGAEVVWFDLRPPEIKRDDITFVEGEVTGSKVLTTTIQDKRIDNGKCYQISMALECVLSDRPGNRINRGLHT